MSITTDTTPPAGPGNQDDDGGASAAWKRATNTVRQAMRRRLVAVAMALIAIALIAYYHWQYGQPSLPAGIVATNGRLEADEIDVATKFAGRVAEVLVDEGDTVKKGQIIARMDVRDFRAALRIAQSQLMQAQDALGEARANVDQQLAQVTLAKRQLERARILLQAGFATKELYEQRIQALDGSVAGLAAARARVGELVHAVDAAQHEVDRNSINVVDNTLVAPRDGRVQYRLAEPGEVLSAGGKVFTVLDLNYVYMDAFLPTLESGRVVVGGDARVVLDALPDMAIPAKVMFVADQAQFTPKAVETTAERDKLMFRIRVRVQPAWLRAHMGLINAGQPGMTYFRLDRRVDWPPELRVDARR